MSRKDRKRTSFFKDDGDPYVADWLREAERIVRSNDWDCAPQLMFFADRLEGEAAELHHEYLESHPNNVNYYEWKNAFKQRFIDETDIDRFRTK